MMDFSEALNHIKNGKTISRRKWGKKGIWVGLVRGYEYNPDKGNAAAYALGCEKLPYLLLKTADHCITPWVASHADLLADDWEVM
jgi:hypothetical protein